MISPIEKEKIEAELKELSIELEAAATQMEEAASFGDIRENEPFHIAKAKYVSLQDEISAKRNMLNEPVETPVGNAITVGRLLQVTYLGMQDSSNRIIEPKNERMLLLFSEEGDPVVQGILSTKCEFGRLINNGREGTYSVSTGSGSRVYDVRIFTGDTSEYFAQFPPSRKAKIERLLGGELA